MSRPTLRRLVKSPPPRGREDHPTGALRVEAVNLTGSEMTMLEKALWQLMDAYWAARQGPGRKR